MMVRSLELHLALHWGLMMVLMLEYRMDTLMVQLMENHLDLLMAVAREGMMASLTPMVVLMGYLMVPLLVTL